MRRLLTLAVISFMIPGFNAYAAAPAATGGPAVPGMPDANQVGVIAAFRGGVTLNAGGQVGREVESGAPIFLGDAVSTEDEGTLQILLLDETVFTIGPKSSIIIDKFIYDPADDSGEVRAKVVEGVFRFVTGKIAHKNPSHMEVELPSGTIGIRGTIVEGEVRGNRSLVVLMGPGAQHNTQHHEGRITVSNSVEGKVEEVEITKTGFGTVIEGGGEAPARPFQVPASDMARISGALQPSAPGPMPGPSQPPADGGDRRSATEQSGQERAQAGPVVRDTGRIRNIFQQFAHESEQVAQSSTAAANAILDGHTSRNQLQAEALKINGVFKYNKSGVPINGAGETGNYTINVEIDFGARRVGGGLSHVTGSITSGAFMFGLPERPFGAGPEQATFDFGILPNQTTSGQCGPAPCTGRVTVELNNRDGVVAAEATHGVRIVQTGRDLAAGGTLLQRTEN